jgi:isochorismate synthase / 2-succinyl-5-enolpyruvyl-6-hydroxy-3-cyclohexene-1-carboxylate synthase / 2-succinyl-6-hydroxy-2,4-cyclohexadiene-1-carboxylate synthase / o-succinylbenzoate synthase
LKRPLLIVAGEKDKKFKEISKQIFREARSSKCGSNGRNGNELCEMMIIPESGHAIHVENPLPLVRAVRKFLLNLH